MRTPLLLDFGDGKYNFRLTVAGVLELQDKVKAGFGMLAARVLAGRYTDREDNPFGYPLDAKYRLEDLLETIRLALVGGGGGIVNDVNVPVDPPRAVQLVKTYCFPERPLSEAWTLAAAIIGHACEEIAEATIDVHPVKKNSKPRTTRKVA